MEDAKHICDHMCQFGYEDLSEQWACYHSCQERWREVAEETYPLYQKWSDGYVGVFEDDNGDEVEESITITIPKYEVALLDHLRLQEAYFEMGKPISEINVEKLHACFNRKKFLEYVICHNGIQFRDNHDGEPEDMIEKEASFEHCKRALELMFAGREAQE